MMTVKKTKSGLEYIFQGEKSPFSPLIGSLIKGTYSKN
jgi:hypothetical protein